MPTCSVWSATATEPTARPSTQRERNLGVEQLRIAPRSAWQNGYAERWAGPLRRELLDHVVVLSERHILHLVRQHARYCNDDRPHMSLDGDAPVTRATTGAFTSWEIAAAVLMKRRYRKRNEPEPNPEPSVGGIVLWLAELGGYTGKSSGGPPRSITIRRGFDLIALVAAALEQLRTDGAM